MLVRRCIGDLSRRRVLDLNPAYIPQRVLVLGNVVLRAKREETQQTMIALLMPVELGEGKRQVIGK
jgi:hypothetical protein